MTTIRPALMPRSRRARKLAEARSHLLIAHQALLAVHGDNMARIGTPGAMTNAQLCDQVGKAYNRLTENLEYLADVNR